MQRGSDSLGVLPLGTPSLRKRAEDVDSRGESLSGDAARLLTTLDNFRATFGFGRAISGPQIGIDLRMIAVRMAGWPSIVINPVITWQSADSVTLWDDCMCFPDLLVLVRRSASISLSFTSLDDVVHQRARLNIAEAELFQHEVDHLNGILAIDRAEGRNALISRSAFVEDVSHFHKKVDYIGSN
ncbi:peptide deformylase [Sphingosinicella rhizophila]|uniref:Peptide deformylase n=1 Tax=Sphingosinicella rhizophila TaxID=3050082 RepID=A0ABU3QCQ9_9SPHN|nr:peptide deformylase [Sphingosinicella sp. GR2756]MDT9601082.1 peptide deformylase [Sphingosinicella sp. GR2756]